MDIHPFLQKQGITSIEPYTKRLERIKEEFCNKYQIETPAEAFEFPVPMIIGSEDSFDFVEIEIQGGNIISEIVIIEGEGEPVLIRQQQLCRRISEQLRQDKVLNEEFNRFRLEWNIPNEGKQESFFYDLSCGRYELYLPGIIRDTRLKDGIGDFCNKLKLRKEHSEELEMVAAYVLFGDFMDYEDLPFFAIQTTRLFKVPNGDGYFLYLEMKPSLLWERWAELYRQTRMKLKREGFIPGDGRVVPFSSITEVPEEFSQLLVLSVPSGNWRNKFREVRDILDQEYGKNYLIRDEPLLPVTQFVINELATTLAQEERITEELYDRISIKVMEKFAEGNAQFTYSDVAVKQVWYRYRKEIIEIFNLMCHGT